MSCLHFTKLCELTLIVDEILKDLFSIKATKTLHSSLEATLEVAKPLRIRLTEWSVATSRPTSSAEPWIAGTQSP